MIMLEKHRAINADYQREQYLSLIRRQKTAITLARWGILVLLIVFWEFTTRLGWLDPFIISSPSRVIKTIGSLLKEGTLFMHIGVTVLETVIGFMLGTILGTIVAIMLWWSPTACKILDPWLVILNALPKIALGPIIIVWIGADKQAIIAMALLISLIVTIVTVLNGFLEIGNEKLLLMKSLGASKFQELTMVILPGSIPTIIAALKLNVGMSWVGVIVGEFLVSKAGLGYLIVYGGQVFKLDLVMTSIVILCVAAALMYYLVLHFEKIITKQKKA